jgi:cytochrome P450
MNVAVAPSHFRPPAAKRNKKPLSAVGILAALARNPIEIWSDFHFEHPLLIGKTFFGYRAVVSDPAAVRRVFLDNVANYRKDEVQLRILRPGLGSGLLTVDGEAWKAQRRSLAPLFSPRQVAAFAPAMHRVTRLAVDHIADRPDGAVVQADAEMGAIALKVLEQTLFSQGLGRDASEFQKAVTRYFDTIGRIDPLDVLGAPDFLPRIGRIRGKGSLDFFAAAVEDIINARRTMIASGAAPPEDLLTLLLRAADPETGRGMSDIDMRANIVTFINAGHETTANALTWTLYLLSQSPHWRARVEAEIDETFDPADDSDPTEKLPVTRAVFEEAMRLYPPAANLVREAISEDWLAGFRIPAGTIVSVSPYVLHRHRTLWKNPDDFDPSRFLPGEREKIDRYAYIPFGAGPRVCIGQVFAMQEGLIVLAHLLKRVRLDLFPGHPIALQQRITLRPRYGMRMIARKRSG